MALDHLNVDYYANYDGQVTLWSASENYTINDIVNYDGRQWKATAGNTNNPPILQQTATINDTTSSSATTFNVDNVSSDLRSGTYSITVGTTTIAADYSRSTATSGSFTVATGISITNDQQITITTANWIEFIFEGEGYYQFVTLDNIVQDFMFSSLADLQNKINRRIEKYEIDFQAQKVVQEFARDVMSVKTFEYELVNSLTMPMPQDLIKVVGLNSTSEFGVERAIAVRSNSSNPRSTSQAGDGTLMFKSNGDLLYANESETQRRYNRNAAEFAGGLSQGFGIGAGTYNYYGGRFFISPEQATSNGTYVINDVDGTISFDSTLAGSVITMTYISDGLSENFKDIKVPKIVEDAIENAIYYRLIRRSSAAAIDKALAKKEAAATKRNAKLALTDFSPRKLIQSFRGKSRWIKN